MINKKDNMENDMSFERKKHVRYFVRILQILPHRYSLLDTSRLTIAFFALSGLDVLNSLDSLSDKNKQEIVEWIYSLQVIPDAEGTNLKKCGFRGSASNGVTTTPGQKTLDSNNEYDCGHIAMTYTGLASLLILGDDLSRVNKEACLHGIKALQLPDGSFKSAYDGSESDMRFIYCACCVCAILDDFSAVDQGLATSFILKSLCYDGAFGQGPGHESHGGSTFCACASLRLMNKLEETLSKRQLKKLEYWCVSRQKCGFHGRPHKDDDTCYSFWVGATLKLLGSFDLIDLNENEKYILSTQDVVVGGLAKWPQIHPDALHSYMGVCGLALMGQHDLLPVDPALNITLRAKAHMEKLHRQQAEQKRQKLRAQETARARTRSSGSTLDRNHTVSVVFAFAIGLGAVVIPWVYKAYFAKA